MINYFQDASKLVPHFIPRVLLLLVTAQNLEKARAMVLAAHEQRLQLGSGGVLAAQVQ